MLGGKNYLTIRKIFRNPIWHPSTSYKTYVGTWYSSSLHALISTVLPNMSISAKTTDFYITIPHKHMVQWSWGREKTTLCSIKRNGSLGFGVVKWRGSWIPFGTFIASQVQDLEMPEARRKNFKRKPMPTTLHRECGYISVMKIREESLLLNGNVVIPGLLTHFAESFQGISVGASRLWGEALGWENSNVPRACGVFEHRSKFLYLCLARAPVSKSCCYITVH